MLRVPIGRLLIYILVLWLFCLRQLDPLAASPWSWLRAGGMTFLVLLIAWAGRCFWARLRRRFPSRRFRRWGPWVLIIVLMLGSVSVARFGHTHGWPPSVSKSLLVVLLAYAQLLIFARASSGDPPGRSEKSPLGPRGVTSVISDEPWALFFVGFWALLVLYGTQIYNFRTTGSDWAVGAGFALAFAATWVFLIPALKKKLALLDDSRRGAVVFGLGLGLAGLIVLAFVGGHGWTPRLWNETWHFFVGVPVVLFLGLAFIPRAEIRELRKLHLRNRNRGRPPLPPLRMAPSGNPSRA